MMCRIRSGSLNELRESRRCGPTTTTAKGLAYPTNGVIMGGLDWAFSSTEIWLGSALCVAIVRFAPVQPASLATIWIGLSAFMAAQVVLSVGWPDRYFLVVKTPDPYAACHLYCGRSCSPSVGLTVTSLL